jgi:predicted nuclease of predicted toxin-antitoxin system
MRFLVDAQLPPALARWLAEQGEEAERVMDRDLQSASGRQIWEFAVKHTAVILTKDEDFAQRQAATDTGPAIVSVRLPNARRRDILEWFGKALPSLVAALENEEPIIEII